MVIEVGIVDDSLMVRSTLEKIINGYDDFRVVGTAKDVYEARTMLLEEEPDVLTLDVEMPKMDGISFLKRLMEHHPMPVVMVSSLTKKTSRKGMEALDQGAVDVVAKPSGDKSDSIRALEEELMPKLRAAYRARHSIDKDTLNTSSEDSGLELEHDAYDLILIGSSTGGVDAIKEIFSDLRNDLPPILIVQHMPPVFTEQFAERINDLSKVDLRQASDRNTAGQGQALLAPGDQHMIVRRVNRSGNARVNLDDSDPIYSQKPSVEKLFQSAAGRVDGNILAAVLTGMGKDGRDGAKMLAEEGATILAQDEESSTVYGMPKQVKENVPGANTIALDQIAEVLNRTAR